MSDPTPVPRRRKSWLVLVPLALFLLAAAGWSGVWVYAANRAETEIETWIAREARLGRVWSCGSRSLGGFPFRFELVCHEPALVTQGGDSLRITAARAHAVAQIWAPNHIVAEFDAPARVEDTAAGRTYDATWTLLQMSGVGDATGRPQRLSLVADQPSLQFAYGGTRGPDMKAEHVELHVRRSPATAAVPDGVDFAAQIRAGDSSALAAGGPIDVNLQGSVSAAEDLRPMPLADRIRAWAAANGIFKLDTFEVLLPKATVTASGALSVDPQGRLFGAVNLGFAGLGEILKPLASAGLVAPEMASIANALAMAGKPSDVAGRPGSTFGLVIKEGVVQLGRFPMGIIPPLFQPPAPPPPAPPPPTLPVTPGDTLAPPATPDAPGGDRMGPDSTP